MARYQGLRTFGGWGVKLARHLRLTNNSMASLPVYHYSLLSIIGGSVWLVYSIYLHFLTRQGVLGSLRCIGQSAMSSQYIDPIQKAEYTSYLTSCLSMHKLNHAENSIVYAWSHK